MRSRRLSFLVGWTVFALLAVLGFAAFGSPDPTPEEVQVEALANSIGHTSGAYAGVSFAFVPGASGVSSVSAVEDPVDDPANPATVNESAPSEGTIASPSTGWLSQVEVRALVELYFDPADVNKAVRIAWCESRFDPDSVDRKTGAIGLFRHLPRYWTERAANAGFAGADAMDAEASTAAAAWEVYNGGGWEVFACRG